MNLKKGVKCKTASTSTDIKTDEINIQLVLRM